MILFLCTPFFFFYLFLSRCSFWFIFIQQQTNKNIKHSDTRTYAWVLVSCLFFMISTSISIRTPSIFSISPTHTLSIPYTFSNSHISGTDLQSPLPQLSVDATACLSNGLHPLTALLPPFPHVDTHPPPPLLHQRGKALDNHSDSLRNSCPRLEIARSTPECTGLRLNA